MQWRLYSRNPCVLRRQLDLILIQKSRDMPSASQLISSIGIYCQLIGTGMVMIRMGELRVGEHFW